MTGASARSAASSGCALLEYTCAGAMYVKLWPMTDWDYFAPTRSELLKLRADPRQPWEPPGYITRRNGRRYPSRRDPEAKERRRQAAAELWHEHVPVTTIAVRLGVSIHTVKRDLRGVPDPPGWVVTATGRPWPAKLSMPHLEASE